MGNRAMIATSVSSASSMALGRYAILRTRDLDEATSRVSCVLSPHELSIARQGDHLDAEMCHAPLGGVSINRLRYGATVDIDVGRTKDFVLVMMPLAGMAEIHCGDVSVRSTQKVASVVSPTLPLRMRSREDADQIMVRVDRALIERQCAQHLGHDLRAPIEFDVAMDLTAPGGQSWRALIQYLVAELDREVNVFSSPLTRVHAEHLVAATLLLAQPHRYRDELARPGPSIVPAFVRRVEEYVACHADEPLTVTDLAAHAGVSTSTLFAGFREFRNTSPMAHLRRVRLQRVREDLVAGGPGGATVTEVALRWGFTHLGRFACEYKRRFGESPSVTLKH